MKDFLSGMGLWKGYEEQVSEAYLANEHYPAGTHVIIWVDGVATVPATAVISSGSDGKAIHYVTRKECKKESGRDEKDVVAVTPPGNEWPTTDAQMYRMLRTVYRGY
jgi:hypothetical protein